MPSFNLSPPSLCESSHKLLEEFMTIAASLGTSGATCGELFSCLYSQTLAHIWHLADRSHETQEQCVYGILSGKTVNRTANMLVS